MRSPVEGCAIDVFSSFWLSVSALDAMSDPMLVTGLSAIAIPLPCGGHLQNENYFPGLGGRFLKLDWTEPGILHPPATTFRRDIVLFAGER